MTRYRWGRIPGPTLRYYDQWLNQIAKEQGPQHAGAAW